MTYRVTFRVLLDVEFEDNGTDVLIDQAHDALLDILPYEIARDCEINPIGAPQEIE